MVDQGAVHPPGAKAEAIAVKYVKRRGLLRIVIVNFILNVLTLSVYRFWGKTRVRRHIWSSVHINNEPLEYTGTGKELFLGALIVFGILILPTILLFSAITTIYGPQHIAIALLQLGFSIVYLLFYGMAIYRARRYRLSRTLWRGIRGTLVGSPWKYSLLYFGALILKSSTLGWSTPAMNLELQKRMTRDMRFGETSFDFRGRSGALYPAYAAGWFGTLAVVIGVTLLLVFGEVAWLGTDQISRLLDAIASGAGETADGAGYIWSFVVLLFLGIFLIYLFSGMVWTIYTCREMKLFWSYTSFDNARFRMDATTGSLISLWLGNILIFVLTIGIGTPFIAQRSARYLCDRLTIDGTVNTERIIQSQAKLDKRGEGLAEAFDIDIF